MSTNTGHWCFGRRRPYAACRLVLRETPSRCRPRVQALRPPPEISAPLLQRQEPFGYAYDGSPNMLASGLELTNAALVHVIGTMILLGYAQNYYFHLRMSCSD
jgi:hypothetical protein